MEPIDEETQIGPDCRPRCLGQFVTISSFALVLIAGLSLTTDGIYKEYVNIEEKSNGPSFGFRLYAPIGFLMVIYSIAGFCLNYTGKLRDKLFTCWLINLFLIFIGFIREFFSTSAEPKTMNILNEDDE